MTTRVWVGSPRRLAYSRWHSMVRRCLNPADRSWPHYGGRGIFIDPRWMDFDAYYRDTGDKPSSGMTIDRRDNDGPYGPDNWRWATAAEQRANKRYDPNAIKTHCPVGHEYTKENTYRPPNKPQRVCRACGRERNRLQRLKVAT